MRHGSQMGWVHTSPIAAEVVDGQTISNRTLVMLIAPAMGQYQTSVAEVAIPVMSPRRSPFPTAITLGLIDLLEKPFDNRPFAIQERHILLRCAPSQYASEMSVAVAAALDRSVAVVDKAHAIHASAFRGGSWTA